MSLLDEQGLRALGRSFSSIIPKGKKRLSDNESKGLHTMVENLFVTAEQPQLSVKHRVAACNALCGFLDQGCSSSAPELQKLCQSRVNWDRLLALYLEKLQDPPAKPMKQVLSTLMKLLSRDIKDTQGIGVDQSLALAEVATFRALSYIRSDDDLSCVKPSMMMLDVLISKTKVHPLTLASFFSLSSTSSSRTERKGSTSEGNGVQDFIRSILRWARHADVSPVAGRLLGSFCLSLHLTDSKPPAKALDSCSPVWVAPTLEFALESDSTLQTAETYILPHLLCIDPVATVEFLESLPLKDLLNGNVGLVSERDIRFSLLITKVTADNDLKLDASEATQLSGPGKLAEESVAQASTSSIITTKHSLKEKVAAACVFHQSWAVRNAAISLLVHSKTTVNPFPVEVLTTLRRVLPVHFSEDDARARSEFVSTMKRLCLRLRNTILKLRRLHKNKTNAPSMNDKMWSVTVEVEASLASHLEFVDWLAQFSCSELQPTASYQRHITSLKILHLMLKTELLSASRCDVFNDSTFYILVDLVMNAFEDVRSSAASLLKSFPRPRFVEFFKLYTQSRGKDHSILSRADEMLRNTGRADIGDGLGRLHELLFGQLFPNAEGEFVQGNEALSVLNQLEQDIHIASTDLARAVAQAPLHARLISLRYLVSNPYFHKISWCLDEVNSRQAWRAFHDRLVSSCSQVWTIVKPILSIDSPEGQDDEEEKELEIGVKDTLSFSWRALKEASSLMQAAISNPNYGAALNGGGLQLEDYKRIGDLSFIQLAELRHRGAFSTVAQTFASCCIRCVSSLNTAVAELPKGWYKETLLCIQEQASALTRRSAGLPAMITSILAAHPSGDFFDNVVRELQQTAQQPVQKGNQKHLRLPQVHALNCLKEIFNNTRLGPATEVHVEETLTIAVRYLNHNVWALRNCGEMLFKALLSRLSSGTSTLPSRMAEDYKRFSKATYNKYPQLADLVESLLRESSFWRVDESFTDQMFRQVHNAFPAMEIINRIGVKQSRLETVQALLSHQLGNSVWILREKAARTLSYFIDGQRLISEIEKSLNNSPVIQNLLHGRLLCLKFIYERKSSSKPGTLLVDLLKMLRLFDTIVWQNSCQYSTCTYLESATILLYAINDRENSSIRTNIGINPSLNQGVTKNPQSQISEDLRASRTVLDGHFLDCNWNNKLQRHQSSKFNHALARFLVAFDILNSNTLSDSLPSKGDHDAIEMLKAYMPQAYLETFYLRWQSKGIRDLLYLMHEYFKVARLELRDGESLEGFACAINSISTEVASCPEQDPVVRQEVFRTCMEVLATPNFVAPKNPVAAQVALRASGSVLALLCFSDHGGSVELDRFLFCWIKQLRLWLNEASDFPTRFAAIRSIESFHKALTRLLSRTSGRVQLLHIYSAVYDALLDDDAEIRDKAAEIVSHHLSNVEPNSPRAMQLSLTPAAAIDRFMEHLLGGSVNLQALLVQALARLVGMPLGLQIYLLDLPTKDQESGFYSHLAPISHFLDTASHEDTSLFMEEKQNLFKDDAQESERWCKLICGAQTKTITALDLAPLQQWTTDGLELLENTARQEAGRPLGWASKPEVFCIAMRILSAAEVVLGWSTNLNNPTKTNAIRRSLASMQSQDMERFIHPLWSRRIATLLSNHEKYRQ